MRPGTSHYAGYLAQLPRSRQGRRRQTMMLLPAPGTEYATAHAVRVAYTAGDDFVTLDGGVVNRADIVRYTGVEEVIILYNHHTQVCRLDARRPHH